MACATRSSIACATRGGSARRPSAPAGTARPTMTSSRAPLPSTAIRSCSIGSRWVEEEPLGSGPGVADRLHAGIRGRRALVRGEPVAVAAELGDGDTPGPACPDARATLAGGFEHVPAAGLERVVHAVVHGRNRAHEEALIDVRDCADIDA